MGGLRHHAPSCHPGPDARRARTAMRAPAEPIQPVGYRQAIEPLKLHGSPSLVKAMRSKVAAIGRPG